MKKIILSIERNISDMLLTYELIFSYAK